MQADLKTTGLEWLKAMVATVGLSDHSGRVNYMETSGPCRVVACLAGFKTAFQS